jgi:hypothetical protein
VNDRAVLDGEAPVDVYSAHTLSGRLLALNASMFVFAEHVVRTHWSDASGSAAEGSDFGGIDVKLARRIVSNVLLSLWQDICAELNRCGSQGGYLVGGAALQAGSLLVSHDLRLFTMMLVVWAGKLEQGTAVLDDVYALCKDVHEAASAIQQVLQDCALLSDTVRNMPVAEQAGIGTEESVVLCCLESSRAVEEHIKQVVESQREQLAWLANDVCHQILRDLEKFGSL